MSMMTSQIRKFVHLTKTQKSRYLENETSFFLQMKNFVNYRSRATLWQKNNFVADVTLKAYYGENIKQKYLVKGVAAPYYDIWSKSIRSHIVFTFTVDIFH